jgi:hypothetical protein
MNTSLAKRQDYSLITSILVAFSLLVILFVLFSNIELKQTYDSRDYLQASQSVRIYLLGSNEDAVPFLHRPPLLPAYLYIFENKILAAKWLNTICLLLSLWLCYFLARSFQLSNSLTGFYILLTATAYPWLQNHFFLWTEPLFSACILILVWLLINKKPVASVILVCILSYFLRKAGVFLIAGSLICYALDRNLKNIFLVSLICGCVVLCWEGLAIYYSKESASLNILSSMIDLSRANYADAITSWVLPKRISLTIRLLLVPTILILLFYQIKSLLHGILKDRKVIVLAVISCSYVLPHIIFFGTPDYYEAERYLSVMLPVFLLLLVTLIQHVQLHDSIKRPYLIVLIFLWSSYHIGRTIYHFL